MKRLLDNLYIDLIAAVLLIAMLATGYILRFPLPPGTNKSLNLWGLTRHQWGTVHFWISLGLLVLIVVHVFLHWQWIVVTLKRRFGRAASPSRWPFKSGLLTALVLCAVLTLFGWAAHTSVRPIAEPMEVEATTLAPQSDPAEVTFWRDVYPIFERSCLSCHGPARQASNFRVDRREDYFDMPRSGLVQPGNSSRSRLISILSGKNSQMARAEAHRLADIELAIVRAWIDAGAEWPDQPEE